MDGVTFMEQNMPTQDEYPSEYWQMYPKLWEDISRCWKWDPTERPSMAEILTSVDAYPQPIHAS